MIAGKGRLGWQAASRCNQRALVEARTGCLKPVTGDVLRPHTDAAHATETSGQ